MTERMHHLCCGGNAFPIVSSGFPVELDFFPPLFRVIATHEKKGNKKEWFSLYLVSDGDVGALPAVLPCSFHTVLTDGLVGYGNSLRQPAVFQNDLRW